MAGRAGIYLRISKDRTGSSESPEQQLQGCRAKAAERGLTVVDVYEDRDRSAFSGEARRPEYERLLADIQAGQIDTILIWEQSRITRQGVLGIAELIQTGAGLISVKDEVDLKTNMGQLQAALKGYSDRQASIDTSERVKRAHQAAARAGKLHSGGARPYGYTRAGEIVPEEAEILREVARRVLDGGESFRSIAFDLNARAIKTATGADWHSAALARLIRLPRLVAIRTHNGDTYPGDWKPILTASQHRRLVATKAQGTPTHPRHLLAELVVCGRCGGRMKNNGTVHESYCCLKNPGRRNCGRMGITRPGLDRHVREQLFDALAAAQEAPLAQEPGPNREDLDGVIAATNRQIEALTAARFGPDPIIPTNEAYLTALAPLQDRLAHTRDQLAALDDDDRRIEQTRGLQPGRREDLEAWWEAATEVERRDAVQGAVREITVWPATKFGRIFDPTRVTIQFDWDLLVKVADRAPEPTPAEAEAAKLAMLTDSHGVY